MRICNRRNRRTGGKQDEEKQEEEEGEKEEGSCLERPSD